MSSVFTNRNNWLRIALHSMWYSNHFLQHIYRCDSNANEWKLCNATKNSSSPKEHLYSRTSANHLNHHGTIRNADIKSVWKKKRCAMTRCAHTHEKWSQRFVDLRPTHTAIAAMWVNERRRKKREKNIMRNE